MSLLVRVVYRLAAVLIATSVTALGVAVLRLDELRSGYDPLRDSLSVLGEPGAIGAGLFNLLLAGVGLSLAFAGGACSMTRPLRPTGAAIAVSGALLLVAAAVPTSDSPTLATAFHRVSTGGSLAAIVVAALVTSRVSSSDLSWRRLRQASAIAGWTGVAGLLLAAGLLSSGFPGGLWERLLFGLNLAWVEGVLLYLAFGEAVRSAANAAS